MPTNIITTEDLEIFKKELLKEIRELLLEQKSGSARRFIRSAEVMKMLHISPGTLQNFRINGTLPFTRIGGILYYDMEEINKLMEENRIKNDF